MKVYTKTGDNGTTALFGGSRVPKHHIRIEAYGTVDELNSYVGLIRDYQEAACVKDRLIEIQNNLFVVGSILATDPSKENVKPPELAESEIDVLEQDMDTMNEVLPEMKFFVLPGGPQLVSHCHIARCICRRAERNTTLLAESEKITPVVIKYLNRLSDYFFVLSRKFSNDLDAEEIPWMSNK